MILEKETFKKYGYHPKDLKKYSHKRILVECDKCRKIREICFGAYRDLCQSCSRIGKLHSEETKRNIGEKNRNNHHSEETKQKLREMRLGKKANDETKIKMSNLRKGKLNYNWRGGSSFEPYCIKFNEEFKERVREYWDRKCMICDKGEIENGRRMDVHHVGYNKETCCDESFPFFISLCISCHSKVDFDRRYWENIFKDINFKRNNNGKSFYSKEEIYERK